VGERVIGDFGPGGGDARDKRGFSGVRKTDQADIGQQLQLQAQAFFFAGASGLMLGGQEPLARFGEIEKKDAGGLVVNHCPHRDRHVDRTALGAGAIAAFTVPAALGAMLGVVTELKQGVLVNGGDQVDVAAAAAVAARRTAARDVFLPPEGHAAVAAVAGFHQDARLVEK
jgi:hypothetical protein